MGQYYVCIMTNYSRTLYIGITNDLYRRACEHREKLTQGFTSRYKMTQLVYYETFSSPSDAIAREKQLKGWRRSKKIALIESENPHWDDLSVGWLDNEGSPGIPDRKEATGHPGSC